MLSLWLGCRKKIDWFMIFRFSELFVKRGRASFNEIRYTVIRVAAFYYTAICINECCSFNCWSWFLTSKLIGKIFVIFWAKKKNHRFGGCGIQLVSIVIIYLKKIIFHHKFWKAIINYGVFLFRKTKIIIPITLMPKSNFFSLFQ